MASAAMWQVHCFPLCPFSRKVRLALAEKGVPFELVRAIPWLAAAEPGLHDAFDVPLGGAVSWAD